MKAAKQYHEFREQWEETNWHRLMKLAELTTEISTKFFKNAVLAVNLMAYIAYQAVKGLYLITKLILLSEPNIKRIERDETWIFRQIK